MKIADYFSWLQCRAKYSHIRPTTPVLKAGKAHLWWKYAIAAVLEPITNKYKVWSWEFFKARRELRLEYVEVYTNVLEKTKVPKGTLEALELQLESDDIIQYRKYAYAAVAAKPQPKSWFSSSWFSSSSSKSDEDADKLDAEQEAAKLREFKKMMAAEDEIQVATHPEWVGMRATVTLGEISIALLESLANGVRRPLAQLALTGSKLDVKQRPAANAVALHYVLQDMAVHMIRFDDTLQPVLKSLAAIGGGGFAGGTVAVAGGGGGGDAAPLFDLKLETNPLPLGIPNEVVPDVRINLVSQGTEVYVTPPGLSKILKFFKAAESTETLDLSSLYDPANSASPLSPTHHGFCFFLGGGSQTEYLLVRWLLRRPLLSLSVEMTSLQISAANCAQLLTTLSRSSKWQVRPSLERGRRFKQARVGVGGGSAASGRPARVAERAADRAAGQGRR